MRHKRNPKRNKGHRGRQVLLSEKDISKFVDKQKRRRNDDMVDANEWLKRTPK